MVDNDLNISSVTKTFLERAGFDVTTACDAADCMMKLENAKPDLILLDAVLPGINGYELCKKLRNEPKTRKLRVVIYTELDSTKDKELSRVAGADGFVNKPLTVEDLSVIINKIEEFLNLPEPPAHEG